jgi:putative iron-regulated protein
MVRIRVFIRINPCNLEARRRMRRIIASFTLAAGLAAAPAAGAADRAAVLTTYADIAQAMYADALAAAETLKANVDAFVATPNTTTQAAAKAAWLAARIPYQQTEGYRFGNAAVDDWEGKVNAWPLDEGLIDYVDAGYGSESDANPLYAANVIASKSLTIDGQPVDATTIDKALIQSLHEAGGVEANVATGYHVIEFLLWGQDLNGTGPGAGARPASDFDTRNCTGGNCDRRAAYLTAATDLLIDDLKDAVAMWAADGAARKAVLDAGPDGGLAAMLMGLGSLSYGELAGERMKLGLMLHDPEEEHDCFSDNTHMSHAMDQAGMVAIWNGRYKRRDGSVVSGPSLADVVAEADPALAKDVQAKLAATTAAMDRMVAKAKSGMAYDQMIGEGNDEGNAIVQAVIDALVAQAKAFEQAVSALKLQQIAFEGSDSLDNPGAVFK